MAILYKKKNVSYKEFKNILCITDGAIYTHLQRLQDAGYIIFRKEFIKDKAHTIYTLTRKGKKTFREYLVFLQRKIAKE